MRPNKKTLLKFWQAEQAFPRWFKASGQTWRNADTPELFLEWCADNRVYAIKNEGLIYVENTGEVNFSMFRGADVDEMVDSFIDLREELFKEFNTIFCWVLRQNRKLQQIVESVGLRFTGLKMLHGESHGKVLEWHCYSLRKSQKEIAFDYSKMLNFR